MTEYQVFVGIRGAQTGDANDLGDVMDYCREQVHAETDNDAITKAARLLVNAAKPPRGVLFIRDIEVWYPRFHKVL